MLLGDPERLAKESIAEELEKAEKMLSEAGEASQRMLREAYEKALLEAEKKVSSEFSLLEEQLKSLRSRLDSELKNRLAERKNEIVESILKRALEEVRASKRERWYARFLEKAIGAIAEEARAAGPVVLRTCKEDYELVRSIASKYRGLKLSPQHIDVIGGVIGETEDGSVRYDYSIDRVIAQNEARLRNLALKALISSE